MAESPTLEEPKVEEPKVEAKTDDALELAKQLKDLGIDNAGKVQDTVRAAQEAGRLANLLGTERQRAAELEAQLREYQSQRTDLSSSDDYGVDLEKVVEKGIRKFWDNTQREVQKNQQRQMQEFNKIRSHKNYALVGKEFEDYIRTPDYQQDLMAGKSPSEIFYDMSNETLRKHLITMRDALLTGTKSPEDVAVPHTETTQASPPKAEPDNEKQEKIKSIRKNWKGDDSDLEKLLDVLL